MINVVYDNVEVEDFSVVIFKYFSGVFIQLIVLVVYYGEDQKIIIQGEKVCIFVLWQVFVSVSVDNGFFQEDWDW